LIDEVLALTQPFRLSESIWKPSKTALLAPLRLHCVLREKLFHAEFAEITQRKRKENKEDNYILNG
jgi:hypothetical protein